MMSAENALSSAQRDDLRTIAALIIPASAEYAVPGADDGAIQADILKTLGRDTEAVRAALDHLARLAGKPLAELEQAGRDAVAKEFRASGGPEVRAPFPKGYTLEEGDWSLLDPVKAKPPALRRAQ